MGSIARRKASTNGSRIWDYVSSGIVEDLATGHRVLRSTRLWLQRTPAGVIGGETGSQYRVYRSHQMNVEELDKRARCVRLLCFAPVGRLALADVLLAQKLALEL